MVHWTREWQTTSVFLSWKAHEQYEKAKDETLKDELPRSVGAQYAMGDEWRNNSRKNEELEPNKNNTQLCMWLVLEIKSHAVKSNIGAWNVRSMNQGKLEVVKKKWTSTFDESVN